MSMHALSVGRVRCHVPGVLRLSRLVVTDFRNYARLAWRPAARISVLYGPNGSGKTNLLEAISLLVPGRGLRGARQADLPRQGGSGRWAVAARLETLLGEADIGTGTLGAGSLGTQSLGIGSGGTRSLGTGSGGAGVSGATLPGATLPGATLPGATLPGATLPGATLPGASLPAAGIPGADNPGASEPGGGTPADDQAADSTMDRRVFRLDGAAPRNQAEITARIAAVWLTPQMDRLFQEGLSGRRRFLDRLVWALEPNHAREIAAHDTAMGNRNRLLADGRHAGGRQDRAWLSALEDAMARHAVAATAARMTLVARLNNVLDNRAPALPAAGAAGPPAMGFAGISATGFTHGAVGGFPVARISLVCPIAEQLAETPALAVEDWLRGRLEANRPRDMAAGATSLGTHRTDMVLSDAASGISAALASTGEQKALLVGVILGHAALIADARGFAPLLLMDEPTVHLDPARRGALFEALAGLSAQTIITGTDAETFLPLAERAEALRTGGGTLDPDLRFHRLTGQSSSVASPL